MGYIRGKYVNGACDLLDYLKSIGISALAGYMEKKRCNTLIVRLKECNTGDTALIPKTFRGFKVKVEAEVIQ